MAVSKLQGVWVSGVGVVSLQIMTSTVVTQANMALGVTLRFTFALAPSASCALFPSLEAAHL